jgi:DsbC/DsbD-like thiol-disulfide interchange protein
MTVHLRLLTPSVATVLLLTGFVPLSDAGRRDSSEVYAVGFLQPAGEKVETPHLTIATSAAAATAAPGGTLRVFVDIAPKSKMHVYAPGEKDGIPVALTIEPNAGVRVAAPEFPAPQKYYFEALKLTQLVYSKAFRIAQSVTLTRTKPASEALTIKGSLRYQACDDTVCYLPKSVPLSWTLR